MRSQDRGQLRMRVQHAACPLDLAIVCAPLHGQVQVFLTTGCKALGVTGAFGRGAQVPGLTVVLLCAEPRQVALLAQRLVADHIQVVIAQSHAMGQAIDPAQRTQRLIRAHPLSWDTRTVVNDVAYMRDKGHLQAAACCLNRLYLGQERGEVRLIAAVILRIRQDRDGVLAGRSLRAGERKSADAEQHLSILQRRRQGPMKSRSMQHQPPSALPSKRRNATTEERGGRAGS